MRYLINNCTLLITNYVIFFNIITLIQLNQKRKDWKVAQLPKFIAVKYTKTIRYLLKLKEIES